MARSHPSLKRDAGIAFSCEVEGAGAAGDRAGVAAGRRRVTRRGDVIAAIRRGLVKEYLLSPYAVILIAGGSLPKTSSGKPRRRYCRDLFLSGPVGRPWPNGAGRTRPAASRRPSTWPRARPWKRRLPRSGAKCFARSGSESTTISSRWGGDSLLATELYLRLAPLVPGDLPLEQLFERPTVAALAELVLSMQAGPHGDGSLTDLLERLEGMSDEEASKALGNTDAALARDNASLRP